MKTSPSARGPGIALIISAGIGFIGSELETRASPLLPDLFVDSGRSQTVPLHPLVTIDTSLGSFTIRLFENIAPVTVGNFLDAVNSEAYARSLIHRSEPGYAVYGGEYRLEESGEPRSIEHPTPAEAGNRLPIRRGTISMVQTENNALAGTSQWRLNTAEGGEDWDEAFERIVAFGEVVGEGMGVVDAINAVPTIDIPPFDLLPITVELGPEDEFSADYTVNVLATAHYPHVEIVTQTAPDILAATVHDRNLLIESNAGVTGSSDITIRFSGAEREIVETFRITAGVFDFFGVPPGAEPDESFWLGKFSRTHFNHQNNLGWIRHDEHGWLYAGGKGYFESLWLWDHIQQDWLWTRHDIYPFLYSDNLQAWLYYWQGGDPEKRYFYDYSLQSNNWMQVP